MDDRALSWVAVLSATLLCGLPGLVSLCCGGIMVLAGLSPEAGYSGDMTPEMTQGFGIAGLCVGGLFVLIPIVVGFFTLRRKPDLPKVNWDEPIPPPI